MEEDKDFRELIGCIKNDILGFGKKQTINSIMKNSTLEPKAYFLSIYKTALRELEEEYEEIPD